MFDINLSFYILNNIINDLTNSMANLIHGVLGFWGAGVLTWEARPS